jgi:hypothetical protein
VNAFRTCGDKNDQLTALLTKTCGTAVNQGLVSRRPRSLVRHVSVGELARDIDGSSRILVMSELKAALIGAWLWGSRGRPAPLACVIGIGRYGMIVSRVLASALPGLVSAGEPAVVARPLVSV